jgi:hypothetical protein
MKPHDACRNLLSSEPVMRLWLRLPPPAPRSSTCVLARVSARGLLGAGWVVVDAERFAARVAFLVGSYSVGSLVHFGFGGVKLRSKRGLSDWAVPSQSLPLTSPTGPDHFRQSRRGQRGGIGSALPRRNARSAANRITFIPHSHYPHPTFRPADLARWPRLFPAASPAPPSDRFTGAVAGPRPPISC